MAEVRKRAKKSVTEEDVESALMAYSSLDSLVRALKDPEALLQALSSQGSEGAVKTSLTLARPQLEPSLRDFDIEWNVVEQAVTAGDGAPSLRRVQEAVVKRMVRTEACQQVIAEARKRAKKSVSEEDVES